MACSRVPVELTRSRAYKSNDRAREEQKNGIAVRRVVGHRRLEGAQQLERLCQLYAALCLFTKIYQPSSKQIPLEEADLREGRRPRRHHDKQVLTEPGILHQMRLKVPGKSFYEVLGSDGCSCNACP
jgi:hypothetical protein